MRLLKTPPRLGVYSIGFRAVKVVWARRFWPHFQAVAQNKNPPDDAVIERAFSFQCPLPPALLQSEASASFNVLLGRIAADVLAVSGR